MALRIRRSIRLGHGLRLNLGRRGGSVSVGGRGLTTTFGPRGTRTTVGIPGTGVSWSTQTPRRGSGGGVLGVAVVAFVLWVLYRMASG